MLGRFDLYLLDRIFNPLSIRLYKRFGLSNFTAAKFLIMAGTALLLLLVYLLLVGRLLVPHGEFLIVLCLLEFWYATVGLKAAVEQEAKWTNPRPGQLPDNLRDAPCYEVKYRRLFLSLAVILGTADLLAAIFIPIYPEKTLIRDASWVAMLAGFYFLACTPPGPRERQEREARTAAAYSTSQG
ncbi:MAG TPA: hypothetical protein VGB97_02755 [Candidatus Paceibacterota bacterium]|jgi:hypothetical protein